MMDYKRLWIDFMRYLRETKQKDWTKDQVVDAMKTKELNHARKLSEKKE